MSSKQGLPTDWTLEFEETTHDSMMARDYSTVLYRQTETGATVRIFEVLQAKANSWGFHVQSSGRDGDLGTADNLDKAKEVAFTYMTDYQAA